MQLELGYPEVVLPGVRILRTARIPAHRRSRRADLGAFALARLAATVNTAALK